MFIYVIYIYIYIYMSSSLGFACWRSKLAVKIAIQLGMNFSETFFLAASRTFNVMLLTDVRFSNMPRN